MLWHVITPISASNCCIRGYAKLERRGLFLCGSTTFLGWFGTTFRCAQENPRVPPKVHITRHDMRVTWYVSAADLCPTVTFPACRIITITACHWLLEPMPMPSWDVSGVCGCVWFCSDGLCNQHAGTKVSPEPWKFVKPYRAKNLKARTVQELEGNCSLER